MANKKKYEFTNFHTIKNFIIKDEKMKSADDAVKKLMSRIDSSIKKVIGNAGLLAKEDRRKTIMLRDIEKSLDENIGKIELTWQELLKEVLKQNPTELGKISEGIQVHLRKER